MRITVDQARRFGKRYVGAINTGRGALENLLSPGAEVAAAGGARSGVEAFRAFTPQGRAWFRGARVAESAMMIKVRVLYGGESEEQVHRLRLDDHGRIASIVAGAAPAPTTTAKDMR